MTNAPDAGTTPAADVTPAEADPEATLDLLTDDIARAVFEALDDPMTAKAVAEECDIGLSTAYRKLDRLSSLGLCRDRIAIRGDGHHVSRYERAVAELRVTIEADGLHLDATRRSSAPVGGQDRSAPPASD